MQHAATDVVFGTRNVTLFDAIETAIAVAGSLPVLIVALVVGLFARRTPQQLALIRMISTSALIAVGLTDLTRSSVDLEHVVGTEFGFAGTIFREIALVLGSPANISRFFHLARRKVAAFSRGARRVGEHFARIRITTRVVAMVAESAVALFAGFDEPVSADRTLE